MRILVADDHAFARKGFRLFVSQIPGVSAVGEAASGVETLRKLRHDGPWQVLILDIDMPDRGGLDKGDRGGCRDSGSGACRPRGRQ